MAPACGARGGFVLVLVCSISAMLLLTGLLLHRMTLAFAAQTAAGSASARARLVASSGMEYAACRLRGSPYPSCSGDPADRGDDWSFREGPAGDLAVSRNPSFSHGEPWLDQPAGRSGAFDPPTDVPGPDLDGDGGLSARTGRIRGGASRAGSAFRLKIVSCASLLPLNAGFLDDQDRNGGGGPDCRDITFLYHKGLAHALNNLGAILLPAGHPRRWTITPPNGRDPIDYSVLGNDLVLGRPPGGYRTVAQLRAFLKAAGGGTHYPPGSDGAPSGLQEILPYLSLELPARAFSGGPPWSHFQHHAYTATPYAPVELATAPRAVLESLWRYMASDLPIDIWGTGGGNYEPRADPSDGASLSGPASYVYGTNILYPDEAARLADFAISLRTARRGRVSWNAFYASLIASAESATHIFDPSPGDGGLFRTDDPRPQWGLAGFPEMRARYAQTKADLAFATVSPNPHPFSWGSPVAWSGWGIPRRTGRVDVSGDPVLLPQQSQVAWHRFGRIQIPFPEPGGFYLGAAPFHTSAADPLSPLGMTLHPPTRFSVEARSGPGPAVGGPRASVLGVLRAHDAVELTSQEDFENLSGGWTLPSLGLQAVNDSWMGDPAGGRRQIGTDPDTLRTHRLVSSLPRWHVGSYPTGVVPPFLPVPPSYPRHSGGICLASREAGLQGADLYWPFGESLDGGPQEFKSEGDAAIPWKGNASLSPMNPGVGDRVPSGATFRPLFVPFQVSGFSTVGAVCPPVTLSQALNPPAGCPGCVGGAPVSALTVEGWVTVGRIFWPPLQPGFSLKISGVTLAFQADVVPNTNEQQVRFQVFLQGLAGAIAKLRSDDASRTHHFAVTVEWDPVAVRTNVQMFIDGALAASSYVPGSILAGADEQLAATMVDDIRIHGVRLPPLRIQQIYEMGKFVKAGVYRSPRYVADRPIGLSLCQWTSVAPDGLKDLAQNLVDPVRVTVIGYADEAGTSQVASALLPQGSGAIHDLAPLGLNGIRSFLYQVEMNASSVPGPLVDTPVLESIWFSVKGMDGRWLSWEAGE